MMVCNEAEHLGAIGTCEARNCRILLSKSQRLGCLYSFHKTNARPPKRGMLCAVLSQGKAVLK